VPCRWCGIPIWQAGCARCHTCTWPSHKTNRMRSPHQRTSLTARQPKPQRLNRRPDDHRHRFRHARASSTYLPNGHHAKETQHGGKHREAWPREPSVHPARPQPSVSGQKHRSWDSPGPSGISGRRTGCGSPRPNAQRLGRTRKHIVRTHHPDPKHRTPPGAGSFGVGPVNVGVPHQALTVVAVWALECCRATARSGASANRGVHNGRCVHLVHE
jgi:hypothetical protein